MILNNTNRKELIALLKQFNHYKIESKQIKNLKSELLFRIWLQNSVRELLAQRHPVSREILASIPPPDDEFDKQKISTRLQTQNPEFKTLTDKLKYFKENLKKLENPRLEDLFVSFLRKYMQTLKTIHEMMNRKVSVAEVEALKLHVGENFADCSGLAKKLKELSAVAVNQEKLAGVMERIDSLYRKHDSKREILAKLKNGEQTPNFDLLEKTFDRIYEEGSGMVKHKTKGFLSSMKKAYETYLNLRKKEKNLQVLSDFVLPQANLLGKRENLDGLSENEIGNQTEIGKNQDLSDFKTKPEISKISKIEKSKNDLQSSEKLDLGLKKLKTEENPPPKSTCKAISPLNPKPQNGVHQEISKIGVETQPEKKNLKNNPTEMNPESQKSSQIKNGNTPNPDFQIKNENPQNNLKATQPAKESLKEIKKPKAQLPSTERNLLAKMKKEIQQDLIKLKNHFPSSTATASLTPAEEKTSSQIIQEETRKLKAASNLNKTQATYKEALPHNKIVESREALVIEEEETTSHKKALKAKESSNPHEPSNLKESQAENDQQSTHSIQEESEDDSLKSLFESEISSCQSSQSNEFILKQKKKIRKLKNLVISKREEQDHLVNESEEKTSAFLYKKFSLVLLYYKLKVLSLDPETAAKTETYLKTVRDTDLIMKKTALAKVTVSELNKLVQKCENMKYFSQGYQKFKRLSLLFQSFNKSVSALREDFRGDMRISFELRDNFLRTADIESYNIKLISSKQKIVLSRKALPLLGEDSKQKWVKLSNKRKTKLRQNFGAVESTSRTGKRKPKPKILHAMHIMNNEELYCLCQEKYELTSMLQFSECEEWFHKECIKIPKYQMRKTKEKFCPACFFLHPEKSEKFKHFSERKRSFSHFLNLYRTAKVLANFLLDSSIDEVFHIHFKLVQLHEKINGLLRLLEVRRLQNQALSPCWKDLHTVTLMYLYVPVYIESVEKTLKNISILIISQSNRIIPTYKTKEPETAKDQNLEEQYVPNESVNPDPNPSAPAKPAQSPNPFIRPALPALSSILPASVTNDFKAVEENSEPVQLTMKGVEVVQVPASKPDIITELTRGTKSVETPTPTQLDSILDSRAKSKSIYGSLLNSAYLEIKKEKLEQTNTN